MSSLQLDLYIEEVVQDDRIPGLKCEFVRLDNREHFVRTPHSQGAGQLRENMRFPGCCWQHNKLPITALDAAQSYSVQTLGLIGAVGHG